MNDLYKQFKYEHLKNVKQMYKNYSNVVLITRQIKLDGTQGNVFSINNKIFFASRNVVLIETDNAGFKQYLINLNMYQNYINDNSDGYLIGEWMVQEKKFYIFDEAKLNNETKPVYCNFLERCEVLKNKYNFDVIQPEIIYHRKEPVELTSEEIKTIIYQNSTFTDTTTEGFVFKIYTQSDNKIQITAKFKHLNNFYKRLQVNKIIKIKRVYNKDILEFFYDNPNLFHKICDKVNVELNNSLNNNSETFKTILSKDNLNKYRQNLFNSLHVELKEYEKDTRKKIQISEKDLTTQLHLYITEQRNSME